MTAVVGGVKTQTKWVSMMLCAVQIYLQKYIKKRKRENGYKCGFSVIVLGDAISGLRLSARRRRASPRDCMCPSNGFGPERGSALLAGLGVPPLSVNPAGVSVEREIA
jgi:hypothetical protein